MGSEKPAVIVFSVIVFSGLRELLILLGSIVGVANIVAPAAEETSGEEADEAGAEATADESAEG